LLGINRFAYLRKLLKYQAPKNKSQTNNNNQKSKFKTDKIKQSNDCNVLVIGFCNFDIVCILNIVIWEFGAPSGKVNRYNPNQLELTLTFTCLPWSSACFLSCKYAII